MSIKQPRPVNLSLHVHIHGGMYVGQLCSSQRHILCSKSHPFQEHYERMQTFTDDR
jgi:hypothetical protein